MQIVKNHFEVAGGIVLNPDNKVLLVTNQIGTITFPKGTLEEGESYEDAAIREVLEEGGLRGVTLIKELGSISRNGFKTENGHTRPVTKHINMFLLCTMEVELNPVVEDVLKAEWVDLQNVTDLLKAEWVDLQNVTDLLTWPEEVEFYNNHVQGLST
jgi:ADP-ribose pyrophosphatase YjhB (NUDIX family)